MSYFKNSTLEIGLGTGLTDLVDATLMQIRYIKPDGKTKGFFPVDSFSGADIIHKAAPSEIDQSGWWIMQYYVEFGPDIYRGSFVKIYMEIPIDL